MKNVVIYPGTFDPITFGHIDLVERAIQLFDRVVMAIADNPGKKPLFQLDERVKMAQLVFERFDAVEVRGFTGLMTDFAKSCEANIILRGLRVVSDFDYEFQMASMNRMLDSNLETVFLTPAERYTYISSSVVREIACQHGDISKLVPLLVATALKDKFKC